jgi:hypothetical protein
LRYADFETSPLPRLEVRVKIDLKGQKIREFDHSDEDQRLLSEISVYGPRSARL